MKSCFSLYFQGAEIILPKRDIKFFGDFGYVKVFYNIQKEDYSYDDYLVGVVDKEFKEVVPLFSVNQLGKMEIFDNCILICVDKGIMEEKYFVYQIEKKNNDIISFSLPFLDFKSVSKNVVKVQMDVEGNIVEALYDIRKREIVSSYFHFIGDFVYDDEYGELVAKAGYFLPYNEEVFNQVITTINVEGNIVGPYLDYDQQKVYSSAMNAEYILELIVHDMESRGR